MADMRQLPLKRRHLRAFLIGASAMFAWQAVASANGVVSDPASEHSQEPGYDLIISGGRIVDGTGSASRYGDLGVLDGRISAVTPVHGLDTAAAKRRINAQGLVVSPGFIVALSWSGSVHQRDDGRLANKVTQGITTEVVGEGWTGAPANGRNGGDPRFFGQHGFDAWLQAMQQAGRATNVAAFVGATTLRMLAMGKSADAPTPAQLEEMRTALRLAMEDGALGLGSALSYPLQSVRPFWWRDAA